jgi:hypothetical protein
MSILKSCQPRDRPRPEDDVRALLIIGGHEHETSFYSLFDGYKDLGRLPVASSDIAVQSDLRGKYDVLIMYDFARDLNETWGRPDMQKMWVNMVRWSMGELPGDAAPRPALAR